MIKFTQTFFFFVWLNTVALAEGFEDLSYYEKFDTAVQSYKEGRYRLAENQFTAILVDERDYKDPAAQLLMAKSQYRQGQWDKALRSCKSVLSNFSGSPYESDAMILLGDIALARGKITSAFQHYLSVRPLIEDLLYLNEIDERLYTCIGIGVKEERIEGFLFREKNAFNRAIINLARAYQSWKNGDAYDLSMVLNGIDTFYLPGFFAGVFGALHSVQKGALSRSVTLAVILPLSGLDREKGQSYLLGLAEYLEGRSSSKSIRFLIYDTGGSGVNALRIVSSLPSNPAVTAILGPLTPEEIYGLAGLKSPLPILIPKSASPGLSDLSQNLFFLSPSSKTIAQRTAQMMVRELGFEHIAVLSHGSGKTKLMTDYFLEECHQLGIDPVAVEWYIEKPENLSRQLKNIRRAAWSLVPEKKPGDQIMNLEIDSLDALFDVDVTDFFELPSEEEIMDRKDSAKVVLETIQAMYIPIRPDELTYIGTQLPVYNLKTLLFGNENWLDMEVLNQEVIGPHVQGMRVISDVSSALSASNQDSFTNFHALALDHADFIQSIIDRGVLKRRQFLEQLRNQPGFHGKSTSIFFTGKNKNENGSAQVLEYAKKRLRTLGVFDGESFSYTTE